MSERALIDAFEFCPQCGSKDFVQNGPNSRVCGDCGFICFFNPATAVAAVIENQRGEVLLIERARDPGAGLYGLPGGFVERKETAEAALIREAREELGVEIENLRYLLSTTNTYHYRGVTYHVLDLCYSAVCQKLDIRPDRGEVAQYHFFSPETLPFDQFAFASNRLAVETYLKGQGQEQAE